MATLSENIKTELLRICQAINTEIEECNYDGCGIIAERLYLWLAIRGIKSKIVVFSHDQEEIDYIVRNNDINGNPTKAHIVLKLDDGSFLDSEGLGEVEQKICGNYPQNEIPLNVLVAWNIRERGWNTSFDRKQIPKVDRLVFPIRFPEVILPPMFC